MNTMENITISAFSKCGRLGMQSRSKMRDEARPSSKRFHLDPAKLSPPIGNLSGGYQQKALLSRWWFSRPEVLLSTNQPEGSTSARRRRF
jgi:ABC-type sugar transport system ATPase subunit